MIRLSLAAAALAAAPVFTAPLAAQEVTLSPSQALEGYYTGLHSRSNCPSPLAARH